MSRILSFLRQRLVLSLLGIAAIAFFCGVLLLGLPGALLFQTFLVLMDALIAEGNTAAARYAERGKSVRAFRGVGPTGRTYQITALEWFDLNDGLIQCRWGARDSASQSSQLGITS